MQSGRESPVEDEMRSLDGTTKSLSTSPGQESHENVDQGQSDEEGSSDNEKPDQPGMMDNETDEEIENNEGSQSSCNVIGNNNNNNNESYMDFLKILPYLYMVQRNNDTNNASLTPGFELTNSQIDFNPNELANYQNFKLLLQSGAFQALRYIQQMMPNGTDSGNLGNSEHNSNEAPNSSSEEGEMCIDEPPDYDEPLDLTQKNRTTKLPKSESMFRSTQRSEKSYTVQDLEAALQDIQTGKLGTRRAAVIYGIPRSTLRNKVYKLGKNFSPSSHTPVFNRNGVTPHSDEKYLLTSKTTDHPRNVLEKVPSTPNTSNVQSELLALTYSRYFRDSPSGLSLMNFEKLMSNSNGESNLNGNERTPFPSFLNQERKQNASRPSFSLPNYPCRPNSVSSYENYGNMNNSSLGKKSRPKRGKYRNYDREALSRAVQAVQNGEMSVHRAGSYFGVPHSTLEYKVKERHLLRQAKKAGLKKEQNKEQLTSSAPPGDYNEEPSSIRFQQTESNDKEPREEINDPLPAIYESNEAFKLNLSDPVRIA